MLNYQRLLTRKANPFWFVIVPALALTGIFFVLLIFSRNIIRDNYLYEHSQSLVLRGQQQSQTIAQSFKAYELLEEQITDRIENALYVVSLNEEYLSNQYLMDLARHLDLDAIYYHNLDATIIYTNLVQFVGWEAPPGHPTLSFIAGGESIMIEAVRKDSDMDVYYKFGYLKTDHGIIQVGIEANNIADHLGNFEVKRLVEIINEQTDIVFAAYYDVNDRLISSSMPSAPNSHRLNPYIRAQLDQDNYATLRNDFNYIVYMPVQLDQENIGTLQLSYDLTALNAKIRMFTSMISFLLTAFYLLGLILINGNFRQNKAMVAAVYEDPLTGFANHRGLGFFLDESIKDNSAQFTLIQLGIVDFFKMQASIGFNTGDSLILQICQRLRQILNDEMVFRYHSNRFVICTEKTDEADLRKLTASLKQIFLPAFIMDDHQQQVQVRIGVVKVDDSMDSSGDILQKLSVIASSRLKDDNVIYYQEDFEYSLKREEHLVQELKMVLREKDYERFFCVYQPIIRLNRLNIVGFEILSRFVSEKYGPISPPEFIRLSEKGGFSFDVTRAVMEHAKKFIEELNAACHENIYIAINVSVPELYQERSISAFKHFIETNQLREGQLVIEITETTLGRDFDAINRNLGDLQGWGVKIALDDFGTGFSSLYRLKQLNFDIVKIDKRFIDNIAVSDDSKILCGDIISLCKKLGTVVVAEGVEYKEQLDYLIENDCDECQGYLFSRPLKHEDAIAMVKKQCI